MDGFFDESSAGKEKPIKFTLLHTNDEHSSLLPHRPAEQSHNPEGAGLVGGIARLAALIENRREEREGDNTLLLSGGDFLSGDPFSWLSFAGSAPELHLMQEMGYDIITLGNHDLDYGPAHLAAYLEAAGYPGAGERTELIASNTSIPPGHKLAGVGIRDLIIREMESGLKMGFFGLLGDQALDLIKNRDTLQFEHPLIAAEASVKELRREEADVIVALSHSGLKEDLEMVQHVDDIDIIIGAHSHTTLKSPVREEETIIVQAGTRMEILGVLDLEYDPEKETVRLQEDADDTLHGVTEEIEPDEEIRKIVLNYTEELNSLVSEVYHLDLDMMKTALETDFSVPHLPRMSETPFGNFFTDAMRISAGRILGEEVDFAFQANGLIRQGLYPVRDEDDNRGKVSFYQLAGTGSMGSGWDERPGYPLVSGYLTGREIRRVMELSILLSEYMGDPFFLQISGLRVKYDSRRAILFNIPVLNSPLPTGRAVKSLEEYTGSGLQPGSPDEEEDNYRPVPKSDDILYRVVTDYYLARFIPLVGEKVPFLQVELRDEDGDPYSDLSRAVLKNPAGEEKKVWEAVFDYARTTDGQLDAIYSQQNGRLQDMRSFSPLARPVLTAVSLLVLFILAVIMFVNLL